MHKSVLLLASLAALQATAASAADMPLKAPPVPYASYSWTGFYAGGEVGGGWATSQSTILTQTPGATPPLFPVGYVASPIDYSGPLGGFYAGANYQFQQFVVGIDGDYNWAGLTGTGADTNPANGATSSHSNQINWVATVTGRVGLAFNNVLLFAKGGWGWAGFAESSATSNGAGVLKNTSTGTSTHDGWTIGGGLEYGLSPHLSAKLEYDYIKFDTATVTITETSVATGAVGFPTRSVTSSMDMVKAGLAYRF